ncbi:MAG: NAD(P)/FAD-dependent oxidoreductase [Actinomycetota bacterium]
MDIAVVGAGLAGMAAGIELVGQGHQVTVLEASDGPGGRVRTDVVNGFRLDRGFQILLEAYPAAQDILDYDKLDLQRFSPGARIHLDGSFHRVGDPLREPAKLLDTLRAPIGSPIDKARILAFRRAVNRGTLESVWTRPETTAMARLEDAGFSGRMIERFLTPLFAGITLDPALAGSSRVLEFVFRMLSAGDAAVPANGMGAIADQLAARLPAGSLRLSTPVREVTANQVTLEDGEQITADQVVVATGQSEAARLTSAADRGWRGVTSVWFSAPEAPIEEPVLVLSAAGTDPINSLVVMSRVSNAYAPAGSTNVVVSSPVIRAGLVDDMRSKLGEWFGGQVDGWEVLRVDEIERAQPIQAVGLGARGPVKTADGIWVCGDHTTDPSINGALGSGQAIARELSAASAA